MVGQLLGMVVKHQQNSIKSNHSARLLYEILQYKESQDMYQ